MKSNYNKNHAEWSIGKGDYKVDPESTNTFKSKLRIKRFVKNIIGIVLYGVGLSVITYIFLHWN